MAKLLLVLPVLVLADPFLAPARDLQVSSATSDVCGETKWTNIKACTAYFQHDQTAQQECCQHQLESIARDLPWWSWIVIAIVAIIIFSCLIACLCRLGKAILCCPCRLCCPSCMGKA